LADLEQLRRVALALPEATEQDHHGMASFRVTGKIFATVPDEQHVRLMVAEAWAAKAPKRLTREAPSGG
jgi:hypothetical protein